MGGKNEKIDVFHTEEIIKALLYGCRSVTEIDLPIVEGACVICNQSISGPLLEQGRAFATVENNNKYNGASGLRESDIVLEPESFGICSVTGELCKPDIEGEKWQGCDPDHSINDEPRVTMNSYMVCLNGGLIIPIIDGQEVNTYIENIVNTLEYKQYLVYLGFPQEYLDYLVDLHERYPNWVFEPYFTGVDFEEFVKFQIDNQKKCADITDKPEYCGMQKFSEDSSKYYHANEQAVRYFLHPGRILLSDDYMLQFLNSKQILSQKYTELAVKNILEDKNNPDIENAILNSNYGMSPVFVAAIYDQENGPVNEEGVYNLFNIGAKKGRADSIKYAQEHKWNSLEACMAESGELFQKYLNRGQNTLYTMDWHYQGYRENGVYQYATLVNDADKKASILKNHLTDEVLDQNLVLSIPIYNNLPPYTEEDIEIFFE